MSRAGGEGQMCFRRLTGGPTILRFFYFWGKYWNFPSWSRLTLEMRTMRKNWTGLHKKTLTRFFFLIMYFHHRNVTKTCWLSPSLTHSLSPCWSLAATAGDAFRLWKAVQRLISAWVRSPEARRGPVHHRQRQWTLLRADSISLARTCGMPAFYWAASVRRNTTVVETCRGIWELSTRASTRA